MTRSGIGGRELYPLQTSRAWNRTGWWAESSLLVAPLVGAALICLDFSNPVERAAFHLFWTYAFGVLWGIGGLTFGLSMRYLACRWDTRWRWGFVRIRTIIPRCFRAGSVELPAQLSGQVTLAGVAVCLASPLRLGGGA